jgi:hypothetical protein
MANIVSTQSGLIPLSLGGVPIVMRVSFLASCCVNIFSRSTLMKALGQPVTLAHAHEGDRRGLLVRASKILWKS